jgi:hypothetical protein
MLSSCKTPSPKAGSLSSSTATTRPSKASNRPRSRAKRSGVSNFIPKAQVVLLIQSRFVHMASYGRTRADGDTDVHRLHYGVPCAQTQNQGQPWHFYGHRQSGSTTGYHSDSPTGRGGGLKLTNRFLLWASIRCFDSSVDQARNRRVYINSSEKF